MPVRFDCPSCKANYEVADDLSGKMIMCRVCKKRGAVRNQMPSMPSTVYPNVAITSSSESSSRRTFLIGGVILASLGAIGAGALLARQPWRRGQRDDRRDRGGFRGPPDDKDKKDDKKDDKGGAV